MILGGIDIGTNSLRLLVADAGAGAFRILHTDRKTTRLGQGLEAAAALSREARERSVAVLREFGAALREYGVRAAAVVGTSALRTASNAAAFLEEVKAHTGLEVRIISGDEEARLTLLGVQHAVRSAGRALASGLVVDIGGGSTEVIVVRDGSLAAAASLPLGAVYLTERFIVHDPPLPPELASLQAAVRTELRARDSLFRRNEGPAGSGAPLCAGTAGTITTLAAMVQKLSAYDPLRINDFILTRTAVAGLVDRLSASTLAERRNMPGLERGREDIILAGAVIVREILAFAGFDRMVVSDGGLREGIVLDLYETMKNES